MHQGHGRLHWELLGSALKLGFIIHILVVLCRDEAHPCVNKKDLRKLYLEGSQGLVFACILFLLLYYIV